MLEATLRLQIRNEIVLSTLTYGISDRFDVGVTVPFVTTTLNATVDERILRLGTAADPTIHSFDGLGADRRSRSDGGTASGLGDIGVTFKYNVLQRDWGALSAFGDVRFPTGDVDNLLKRFSNRPCTTWGGRGTSARTDAGGPMRAYSMDLRERALLDSDAGMKAADVAAKYRVSGSWVRLLKQRRRETGEVAPRVQRHGRRCMLEPHLHTLADLIAAHPDRTLAELKDALATPASVPTVWRAVRALGLTVKKNGPPVRTRSA